MKLFKLLQDGDAIDNAIISLGLNKKQYTADAAIFLNFPMMFVLEFRFTYRKARVYQEVQLAKQVEKEPEKKVSNLKV